MPARNRALASFSEGTVMVQRFCTTCGTEGVEGQSFCARCGQRLPANPSRFGAWVAIAAIAISLAAAAWFLRARFFPGYRKTPPPIVYHQTATRPARPDFQPEMVSKPSPVDPPRMLPEIVPAPPVRPPAMPDPEPVDRSLSSPPAAEPPVESPPPAPPPAPVSGELHYHGPPVPPGGEVAFDNLPGPQLKFTFDHAAWRPMIERQPDGGKRLVMRSLASAMQTQCDVKWEIVP
jgi:hypothetical protein